MMRSLIRGNNLLVNDVPFYVRGAEIQYFRLPVSEWRKRLELAKAGGINTVSSYMPWYWHEPEEGMVDLTGNTKPERDLKGFLELAGELDLKVIARPGPFLNSELRCGGPPEWLFRNHPETMSCRSDGKKATGRPVPAEGEPVYREYVRKWYSHVVPLIAELEIHNGGPVILFQPDNEISAAWSYGLLNSLYDPMILSHFWPRWLKSNYGDVDAVNRRYETAYKNLNEIEPPRTFPRTIEDKRRCLDWMNFKRWFLADWGTVLATWVREYGIKVPIIFNEPVAGFYDHGDHAGFGAILKQNKIQGATACHTYSGRILDLEGVIGPILRIEIMKSSPWGGPPLAVEVNTDWYIPRQNSSEINWEGLMRLGLARGLMGAVIYPYAAGIVSDKDVICGPDYFEPSCISVTGEPSPGYYALKRFNMFAGAWEEELSSSYTVADLTIAYTPGQRLLDFLGAPPCLATAKEHLNTPGAETFDSEPKEGRSIDLTNHVWLDGAEGVSKQTIPAESDIWKRIREVALLFTRMNVSFDLLDLTNPNREASGQKWLVVPCVGSMEKSSVDYLLRHLDSGGGCLFFPTIPICNLDGVGDLRLAERLGVRLADQIQPGGAQIIDYGTRIIEFAEGKRFGTNNWIYKHEFPQGSSIIGRYQSEPIIAKLPFGSGRVIISGVDADFTTFSSLVFWEMVVRNAMQVNPVVTLKGNYYYALLRKGAKTSILTVMNITGTTNKANIAIHDSLLSRNNFALEVELKPHEARCLLINAECDGQTIAYATSEIIPKNKNRSILELHGACGTKGEIAFAEPTAARLEGEVVHTVAKNDYHVIEYYHLNKPLVLELRRKDV